MLKSILNLFKKTSEKSEIEDKEKSILDEKKKIVFEKINSVLDEKKEVILSEDEINQYINQEIENRTYGNQSSALDISGFDPLFLDAAKIVVEHQKGSASLLQRKLKIGYNKAGKLIDELETAEIIGSFNGSLARTVNFANSTYLLLYLKTFLIKNKRFEYFKKHILPLHEELISSKVNEIFKAQETAKENELREILKQEILDKESEKLEKEKRKQLEIQVRKELIENGMLSNLTESDLGREPIPQEILDRVWNRDGGKCVKCGSQEKIEFDHIIPFSKGGSNTYRNLQILCEQCNRGKSNDIG